MKIEKLPISRDWFNARTPDGGTISLRIEPLSEVWAAQIDSDWKQAYGMLLDGLNKERFYPPESAGEAFRSYFGNMLGWCWAWRNHLEMKDFDSIGSFVLLSADHAVEAAIRMGTISIPEIGGECIYVKYLHSAPGNQRAIWNGFGTSLSPNEKEILRCGLPYRPLNGCGKILLLRAIMESFARGWDGRVALSPLMNDPFAVRNFYLDHCYMEQMGGVSPLFYTKTSAQRFFEACFITT